ncbi:hypothetical protein DFJ74DRAFT_737437 [Hyaloraphidium curvatum]|nr:hypothetical protein DFJ74DRAFT_737437 [Hyaloraphidium curvatum]
MIRHIGEGIKAGALSKEHERVPGLLASEIGVRPPDLCAVLFLLTAAAFSGALARPTESQQVGPSVKFAPSCADCDAEKEFCEYAYPGAPADSVACVALHSARELYRRYAPSDLCVMNPTEAGILGANAKNCPTGATMFGGCDYATGTLLPGTATTAAAFCYGPTEAGGQCCGDIGSFLVSQCGNRMPCIQSVGSTEPALNPAGVAYPGFPCNLETGVMGSTNGTGAVCFNNFQPVAGAWAGCCYKL